MGQTIRAVLTLGILQVVLCVPHPESASFHNVSLDTLSREFLERLHPDAKSLHIRHTKIGTMTKNAFEGLPHLNRLEISESEIGESIDPQTFADLPSLEFLVLRQLGLKRVRLNLTNVQKLDLGENKLEAFDGTTLIGKNLNVLDLSSNKLKALEESLSNLSKLSVIDLSRNEISHVTEDVFLKSHRLLRIFAGENKLVKTDGFKLPWLKSLDLFSNKLKALDVDSFPKMAALEELILAFNEIKRIDDAFRDLVELRYLNLAWNKIENLSPNWFRNNLYLTELSLQGNKIKVLEKFQGDLHHLTKLDVSHNQISLIQENFFASVPGLRELNLAFNNLKTISAPLKELQVLNLAYNDITDLNVMSNPELTRLNLSANVLQTGVSLFRNNRKLSELDISGNKIRNFCDGNVTLKALLKMSLKGNEIVVLTCLQNFSSLCEVDLRDNPLACGEVLDDLIQNLAERKTSPYKLVPEFQADLLRNDCENLSLNRSFNLWNSVKRELCPKGRDAEPKVTEWEESEEETPIEEKREKEIVEREPAVHVYVHRPIWRFGNDEMNKPNPLENPQSGRQSWEENSELKDFEDEEIERRPRFSWYTIALILIGLSLTLTCFNLVVFLYIRMKVWKRSESNSPQKYVVLHNEVYKNTTEPSAGEAEWPTENETRNKMFTYGRINEMLLNFGLSKKDKGPESDKNVLIHSTQNF